jgi:hypothetical protein
VVDWATSPTSVIEPEGLRRPITRNATAEWSCASSTITWPYVNGVPLSNVFASSTRNWSAAVQRRRLPLAPGSIRSTSRIGCWVGHALLSTAFSGAACDHASSDSVRRTSAWRASTRSRSRRWLIGTTPCLAMSSQVATSARVNTTVRAPIGTATSSSGGTIAASARSTSSSSRSDDPFQRAVAGSSTAPISIFGRHRSRAVHWRTARSPSDGRTLAM